MAKNNNNPRISIKGRCGKRPGSSPGSGGYSCARLDGIWIDEMPQEIRDTRDKEAAKELKNGFVYGQVPEKE